MTEWGVYLVIASLLATGGLLAKPIMALTRTNTKLECAIDKLTEALGKTEKKLDEHDKELINHDKRITLIEKEKAASRQS